MEKLPHEEYRDNLAEKLKDMRNSDEENSEVAKAKAEGYLEAKQETKEYHTNKDKHKYEIEKQKKNDLVKKEFEILSSTLSKLKENPDIGHVFKNINFSLAKTKKFYGSDELSDEDTISRKYNYEAYETDEELKEKDLEIMKQLHLAISHIDDILDKEEKMAISDKTLFLLEKKYHNVCNYSLRYNDEDMVWKVEKDIYIPQSGILSSLRFKEELQPIENTIEKINKLRGVSFKWKSNEDSPREIGVIAEEVAEVFPELVFLDNQGKPLGVHYDKFVAVLIEAVKDLDKRVKDLEK